ncbi:MSHA biogenesis protein MshJ [Enterovibrio norvegicus FF-33]|uniref:type 4a pilus biogenesis protein PilO n=1 Tax=Enterovibrio norvegicus TaxID=188144 RepID=UPI0002D3D3E4|nr:type 4a pilus biogenesis protein PilO [Enterovibrio norvegicus]OEE70621.1 MSHA biogenesis protein MshJ [Enterovibrio norvegicus FF-33]OEE88642.1 MSHA biogenesis protein MshJ [Enterovibrio norvegicus FF-162]
MNPLIERMKQGFDGLSGREQWLIALAGWAAIIAMGALLFLEPMTKTLTQISHQITQQQQSTQDLLTLNQLKQEKLSVSPSVELEQKLAQLSQQLVDLDQRMADKVEGLVNADQMASLMESVLNQSDRLTLLSMASLPAEQLTHTEDAGYFIHPIEMTLKGRYFDIVEYLTALENLPVKYYWKGLDYRVTDYPWAEVTVQVYTLGESAVFIGGASESTE